MKVKLSKIHRYGLTIISTGKEDIYSSQISSSRVLHKKLLFLRRKNEASSGVPFLSRLSPQGTKTANSFTTVDLGTLTVKHAKLVISETSALLYSFSSYNCRFDLITKSTKMTCIVEFSPNYWPNFSMH